MNAEKPQNVFLKWQKYRNSTGCKLKSVSRNHETYDSIPDHLLVFQCIPLLLDIPWWRAKVKLRLVRPRLVLVSLAISRALLLMTSKADKLPLETEPVALNNNTIFNVKTWLPNLVAPYSTDNRSSLLCSITGIWSCTFWLARTGGPLGLAFM
jgi:hypothetical protein